MTKRKLHLETFESRQLMAFDSVETIEVTTTSLASTSQLTSIPSSFGEFSPMLDCQPTFATSMAAPQGEAIVADRIALSPQNLSLPYNSLPYISLPYFASPTPPNLIIESGSRVIVADNENFDGTSIWVLSRAEDGTLSKDREITIGFNLANQFLDGNRLIVIGNQSTQDNLNADDARFWPGYLRQQTVIAGFDITTGEELSRSVIDGTIVDLASVENGLVLLTQESMFYPFMTMGIDDAGPSSDVMTAVFPPHHYWEPTSQLSLFQWNDSELKLVSSEQVSVGSIEVAGDQLLFLTSETMLIQPMEKLIEENLTSFAEGDSIAINSLMPDSFGPWFPEFQSRQILRQYNITSTGLSVVGEVTLENDSYNQSLEVSADGTHALLTRSIYQPNAAGEWTYTLILDWYSISESAPPTLKFTQSLEGFFGQVQLIGNSYALVTPNSAGAELKLIDFASTAANADRVTNITLSQELQFIGHRALVSGDRLILTATTPWVHHYVLMEATDTTSIDAASVNTNPSRGAIVVLSISEGRVLSETLSTVDQAYGDLIWIDEAKQQFGWKGYFTDTNWNTEEKVLFGRLDTAGALIDQQRAVTGFKWANTRATSEHLLSLSSSRLNETLWSNPSAVNQTVNLFDPVKDLIVAQPDTVERAWPTQSQWIDVLANDTLPRAAGFRTDIVELIGAPPEITIAWGKQIEIAAGFAVSAPLTFQYKISDGFSESIGNVTIQPTSEEIQSRVARVIEQASSDFDLPVEQITILNVLETQWNWLTILDDQASDQRSPNSLIVQLKAGTTQAHYLVHPNGSVTLIYRDQVVTEEGKASLTLRAVDTQGNELQSVNKGETFWLELVADDLRWSEQGVFAAYADFALPAGSLEFTGSIESQGSFSWSIPGKSPINVELGLAANLGGFLQSTLPPGGAPQSIVRVEVRAIGTGDITIALQPSVDDDQSVLLFGINNPLSADQVTFQPLALRIQNESAERHFDINDDGHVTPIDALRVINFLNQSDLEQMLSVAFDDLALEVQAFDVNADRFISPVDALMVINRLNSPSGTMLPEVTTEPVVIVDDEELEERLREWVGDVDSILADNDDEQWWILYAPVDELAAAIRKRLTAR